MEKNEVKNAKILIVDDSQLNLELLEEILKSDGFNNIHLLNDSRQFMNIYKNNSFDLVLMDLVMPHLDGIELISMMRSQTEDNFLPVIMLTAHGDQEIKSKALSLGTKDFIAKPFDRLEVLYRIYNNIELSLLYKKQKTQNLILAKEVETQTKELKRLAAYDSVTNLPNRRNFIEALNNEINKGVYGWVILVAISEHHEINNLLGFDKEDGLFLAISKRLNDIADENSIVAYWAEGYFVLALTNLGTEEDLEKKAAFIKEAIEDNYLIEGYDFLVKCNIGACRFPEVAANAITAVKNAKLSIFFDKKENSKHINIFKPEIVGKLVHIQRLENDFKTALNNNEIFLNYQPKVELKTGKIIGVEALARWKHPVRGIVMPNDFIPIAESSGLINQIGKSVLQKACSQTVAWISETKKTIGIAVNISIRQLEAGNIDYIIENILQDSLLPSSCLELEITESSVMQDVNKTKKTLEKIKKMGVAIAIDDFGTGYSSLSYLQELPIDTLKIDRSFIKNIPYYENCKTLSRTIIAMAKALSLKVIAEGVETEDQRKFLIDEGCEYAQGFLFSTPKSAEDISNFLSSGYVK